MRNFILMGCIAMAAVAPAAAVEVVATGCVSVTDVSGCLFTGNIAPSTFMEAQTTYNIYNNTQPTANPDITLAYLFKSDDGAAFTGSVSGTTSGTWSTPGFLVDFLAVKASNSFVLFKLATPASSGFWSTINIPFRRNPHELSHLAFFGSADRGGMVPEPATWALMIGGFGMVGLASRRRSRQIKVAN